MDEFDEIFGGTGLPRPSTLLREDLDQLGPTEGHRTSGRGAGGGSNGSRRSATWRGGEYDDDDDDGEDGERVAAAAREEEDEEPPERVLPGRRKKPKKGKTQPIKKKRAVIRKGGPIRRRPGANVRRRATPIPSAARNSDPLGDDALAERAADAVARTVLSREEDEYDDDEEDGDENEAEEEPEEEEEAEEEPLEFETIGRVAETTRNRILDDARQVFSSPTAMMLDASGISNNGCYLCAYGHRGIDGLGSQGMQLHGELVRIINDHLYTSGARQTTQMAEEFFNQTIVPFFKEINMAPPKFNAAEVYVHISTPLHTKNNRIFYNWALERMATVADALYSEVREVGRSSNVHKAREARQTLITMRDFYKDRIEQVSFGAPTAGDIQPEVMAHMSRTQLLQMQLPTMSPAALSFVQSLGVMRPVIVAAAAAASLVAPPSSPPLQRQTDRSHSSASRVEDLMDSDPAMSLDQL